MDELHDDTPDVIQLEMINHLLSSYSKIQENQYSHSDLHSGPMSNSSSGDVMQPGLVTPGLFVKEM